MVIIETPIFTKLVRQYLKDDDYRRLQGWLNVMPQVGDIIKGSGGLRKLRWSLPGKGKRGGVRVIYYWLTQENEILMLYIYPKNKQSDLTPQQLKMLKDSVEEEFYEKRNV